VRTGFIALIALILATFLGIAEAAGPDQTMHFEAAPPSQPTFLFGGGWDIFANGVIDMKAASRLSEVIKENAIPDRSNIILNSPGGNLFAGMELGKVIRMHQLRTYIGVQGDLVKNGMIRYYKQKPGICVSACALSFLGGPFRYMTSGKQANGGGQSIYGVHRFYSDNGSLNSDQAQIVSAAVLQYIRDMGVNEELFTEMTKAGKDELDILPEKQLEELGVVNNGIGKTEWTIRSVDQGLYLRGARDTVYVTQKLMFFCQRHQLMEDVMFDPQRNQDAIIHMSAISLEIDGRPFRVPPSHVSEPPTYRVGWIELLLALDPDDLKRLRYAQSVGVYIQFAYDAPSFSGISMMDFREGAKLLRGLLQTCH